MGYLSEQAIRDCIAQIERAAVPTALRQASARLEHLRRDDQRGRPAQAGEVLGGRYELAALTSAEWSLGELLSYLLVESSVRLEQLGIATIDIAGMMAPPRIRAHEAAGWLCRRDLLDHDLCTRIRELAPGLELSVSEIERRFVEPVGSASPRMSPPDQGPLSPASSATMNAKRISE